MPTFSGLRRHFAATASLPCRLGPAQLARETDNDWSPDWVAQQSTWMKKLSQALCPSESNVITRVVAPDPKYAVAVAESE